MISYTFMGLDDVEEGEEISSRKKSFIKRVIAYIKIRRQASRLTRNNITRDRAGAHERLVKRRHFPVDKVHLCNSSIGIRREWPEFLRKPTVTDIEKLYRHHEEKHGFSGMFGRLDCTYWEWLVVLTRLKGNMLDAIMLNNDINVLYQNPLFNDFKIGRAPKILFVANDVSYPSGYYLVDGIYPELAPLVKMIPKPADDDHKRILYKQKRESARKDVERAFSVLKKKWAVLANLTRAKKRKNC
nr:protein ALP1-like [Tanacetum cinerariifolium]